MKTLCMMMFTLCVVTPWSHADARRWVNSQGLRDELRLRCNVDRVRFQEGHEGVTKVTLDLTIYLVNTGTTPIILLKREPVFPGARLAKTQVDLATGNHLHSTYFGPSVELSEEWTSLRNALDQVPPPSDLTRVLSPGETWQMKIQYDLIFDSSPSTYPKQKSFQEVQEASPLYFQVQCDVWPFNLEPIASDPTASRKLPYGHSLQRRWQSFGKLWLDTLFSEPVPLDLKKPTK